MRPDIGPNHRTSPWGPSLPPLHRNPSMAPLHGTPCLCSGPGGYTACAPSPMADVFRLVNKPQGKKGTRAKKNGVKSVSGSQSLNQSQTVETVPLSTTNAEGSHSMAPASQTQSQMASQELSQVRPVFLGI